MIRRIMSATHLEALGRRAPKALGPVREIVTRIERGLASPQARYIGGGVLTLLGIDQAPLLEALVGEGFTLPAESTPVIYWRRVMASLKPGRKAGNVEYPRGIIYTTWTSNPDASPDEAAIILPDDEQPANGLWILCDSVSLETPNVTDPRDPLSSWVGLFETGELERLDSSAIVSRLQAFQGLVEDIAH